ncbi:PDC6I protein, partial [Polypterus senegalus]
MATFISVPLKKTSEVDLAKPLSKFISNTYPAGEEQGDYVRATEELSKLRKSAVGRPLDKHESSLEVLLRYYDQLCAVEPKFPFSENQDRFKVCTDDGTGDNYTTQEHYKSEMLKPFTYGSASLPNLGYEKTCVLFNVGALASQIASEQNLDSDEGLKTAAKYYQLASGTFSHIKDTVLSALSREPTMDISPDTVSTLSQIMLAQAQEVFFLKATSDKMKDAIIAKLANQAADFYGDAFKQCQYKEHLPKEVLPVLAAKHCIMQANAEFHQSILAKQQKKFGEEIGRLQHAADLVKTVASRYDEYINVKDLTDKINRALTAARKDNDFIYHDRVPDLKDMDSIGKAVLVKPTAISVPMSQKFTALDDLSGDSIPQSILEKSRAVIQYGGLQTVDQLIRDLPELLQRNREILDESFKILEEEESTDTELRTKFAQRWQRIPSNELYKPLRTEGGNFRNMLDRAVQADKVVKECYAGHSEMISVLCKPEAELGAAIPSANPTKTLQGSEVVGVLRTLLSNLDELKCEREKVEIDIKMVQFDMTNKFLTALAQDGALNEEAISVTQLDSIYGGYTQKVQQNLKSQEEILGKIQVSHEEFSKMKQSNADSNQREEMLKKLAAAHDNYFELCKNLNEGTKFYNDLTEILLKFQTKCSDIVFARKTERDELLKELQQNIAREPSAPSIPPVPAYQATHSSSASTTPAIPTPAPRTVFQQGKPQPPARPPPPVISSSTPSTSAQPAAGNSADAQIPPAAATPSQAMGAPTQAQGPPYPTYQGHPGFYSMPMPYSAYPYGQYHMPFMYQPSAQPAYPGNPPAQPSGYPYPQQPFYPQQ